MIAAWMIYTVVITTLLFAAATATEYVLRALALPTRAAWMIAMFATLGLSSRALVKHDAAARDLPVAGAAAQAPSVTATLIVRADGTTEQHTVAHPATRLLQTGLSAERAAAHSLGVLANEANVAAFDRWNGTLTALWLITSALAFAWLGISLITVRRIARRFPPAQLDEHSVLLSNDVGPAVFGLLRTRIVVPRWVLSLSRYEREIILTHEREHAATFDPALLCAAAFAVALQPWNPALWALLARLRLAIETDCDRRVLRVVRDARSYGRLLVAVYQRSAPTRAAYVAFVERRSNVELRIRRMTRRPRLLSWPSGSAAIIGTLLATIAWSAPAPVRVAAQPLSATSFASRATTPAPIDVKRPRALATIPARERDVSRPSTPMSPTAPAVDSTRRDVLASVGPTVQPSRPEMSQSPTTSRYVNPCMFAGRMSGSNLPPPQALPKDGCSIDGEVMVFLLDSTRVLVAARDTADKAVQGIDYMVFDIDAGGLSDNLVWSTSLGHVELRGPDVFVAIPPSSARELVFGLADSEMARRHPSATYLRIRKMALLRQPTVTWDVLRRIPSAARCPIIYVDGVLQDTTPGARDCFIVDGESIHID